MHKVKSSGSTALWIILLTAFLFTAPGCGGGDGRTVPDNGGESDGNGGSDGGDGGGTDPGTPTYTVGGTISGLEGRGLLLELNNQDPPLPIENNGPFTFALSLQDGDAYSVAITRQPSTPSQICEVSGGQGEVNGAPVDDISITCSTESYRVGGTITGLAGGELVLRNNGGDELTISDNGPFEFPTALPDLSDYRITVASQPSGPDQICSVTGGSGTLSGGAPENITVSCVVDGFTVGGEVDGLAGSGLVLRLNGGNDLAVPSNGAFTFPVGLADGTAYNVSVATQPTQLTQTCMVLGANGTIDGASISGVEVQCTTDTFPVGGSISGLEGEGLIVTNESQGTDLSVPADGSGSFSFPVIDGGDYAIAVTRQPSNPAQICTVANPDGTVSGSAVNNIDLTCVTQQYTVGGQISNLEGEGLVLGLNNGEQIAVDPTDTAFEFNTALDDATTFTVRVDQQPDNPQQACTVEPATATLSGSDFHTITVECVTDAFSVGGTVSGLEGSGLILQNNGADQLEIYSNGEFTFTTPLFDNDDYDVSVWRQPSAPSQHCAISNDAGSINGGAIDNVTVQCTSDVFTIGGTVSGLDSGSITLANNGGDELVITSNGPFTFDQPLVDRTEYDVDIITHPAGAQRCTIGNESGILTGEDVDDVTVVCPTVEASFPGNGPDWNDYIGTDGTGWQGASDSACPDTAENHMACVHGGEMRTVTLETETSCLGLAARDALDAFDWRCLDDGGTVRFVSHRLKDDVSLIDLIDPSIPAWRENHVSITRLDGPFASTPSSVWWHNPVRDANGGGALSITGSINVVTADPGAAYQLAADRQALVLDHGVTLTGPEVIAPLVEATGQDFLWIEGRFDGRHRSQSIRWSNVRFSALRHVQAMNADSGVHLLNADGNRIEHLRVANTANQGVMLNGSDGNRIHQLSVSNSRGQGVLIENSDTNRLSGLTVTNNNYGIYMEAATDNILANTTSGNNALAGLELREDTDHNLLLNINAVNNNSGIFMDGASFNTFQNLASTDARNSGVVSRAGEGDTPGSNYNHFTGRLKLGGNDGSNCAVSGEHVQPGLINTTCTDSGAQGSSSYSGQSSDATLSVDISQTDTFLLKVFEDDPVNPDDDAGAVTYVDGMTLNWTDFASTFRAWGVESEAGNPFPAWDNRGPLPWCSIAYKGFSATESDCTDAGGVWQLGGRIWDWRLSDTDIGDHGSPVALNANQRPTGDDALAHTWSDQETSVFLRNAVEIGGDGIGNDDLLCEASERCIHTPNIGAYQGHGPLSGSQAVPDGALSGITMQEYTQNGL